LTASELTELKRLIVHVADYYGRTLKPAVISMMAEDLADLPYEQVQQAYERYRRNSKALVFPLPAQIRGLLEPEVTPEAQGRETYARITQAVRKFGYMQADQAAEFIGEHGWDIVKSLGGWYYICSTDTLSQSSVMALIRERAADFVRFGANSIAQATNKINSPQASPQISSSNRRDELLAQVKMLAEKKSLNSNQEGES
jgi:hypothetical protein